MTTRIQVEPETGENEAHSNGEGHHLLSRVQGAETKDGIISIQFKNGFVFNVDLTLTR